MRWLLRERSGDGARVSNVELFFDLVFVFAVTQLSHDLLNHLTAVGLVEVTLLFLSVWWVWIFTGWVTNWLDPDMTPVRLLMFALMAAGLVMSMAIPKAWEERGLVFAAAYAAMQIGRSLFMLAAMHGHAPANFRNFRRITIWLLCSGAFWIAGGILPSDRLALWLTALVIEYIGPSAYFWVPGLGRSVASDWDIQGGHLAERCGLFIIIVLGEAILDTGAAAANLDWTGATVTAFAASFLGSIAMWWIYFNIGAERASQVITHTRSPGRLARLAFNYLHLPIVAGVIVAAAGDEQVLLHPDGLPPAATGALLLSGPALFLLGNLLFKRATGGPWHLSHLIGLALTAVLVPMIVLLSPPALDLASSIVLLIVATWETLSLRSSPLRPASSP